MALMQRLDLRQGQSLAMTPQLQQAIKLLQMSSFELQAFVENEIERNPLLEREEAAKSSETPEVTPVNLSGGKETIASSGGENTFPAEANTVASDTGWASLRSTGGSSNETGDFDAGAAVARSETLGEHLTDQLHLSIFEPADRIVAQNLIGMVNEAGYLTADAADIAAHLGTSLDHVQRVLAVLKSFDPIGVFAGTLEECLALQLRERDRYDPAMAALVANLGLVAKRDFAALVQLCGVDLEDIKDMIGELQRLNPKPGHAFGSEPVQPVVPDIFVRAAQDGTWTVELNTETLPRVLINNQYLARVSRSAAREADKLYLNECRSSANWLIKSLDQRAKTILKVAREIVRQQDAFLVLGVQHLRPINLKTVADAIKMHESTVSRVTSNKYMATPRGTYELKYFFTAAIASSTADGAVRSAESVRQRIRELIEAEAPEQILVDEEIVAILHREGTEIARRTVAKYRESLRIPSSVLRRRLARSNLP